MRTLYERLLAISREEGMEGPEGRRIQALTGLSSGRVTQIKDGGEAARLGTAALQRVIKLGYSADWVQEGRGDPRAAPAGSSANTPRATERTADDQPAVSNEEAELLRDLRELLPEKRDRYLMLIRAEANEARAYKAMVTQRFGEPVADERVAESFGAVPRESYDGPPQTPRPTLINGNGTLPCDLGRFMDKELATKTRGRK